MKKIYFILTFLFFSAASAWAWTADDVSQFEKANANYRGGRYDQAIPLYQGLIEKHRKTAVLFYNLGNSHYRAGAIGPALLAYERARLLEPRNADIEKNLQFVRGLLEYRIEDKRNWYIRAGEKILEHFTEQEIGFLWVISCFLLLGSWAFVLFFRRGTPWGWGRKTCLVLTGLFLLLAFAKNLETNVISDAIVMKKDAEIRYGPSESDRIAFRLGEGLKVYVVDRREDWSRILLVNGESGWVRSAQIVEVRK